MAKKLAFTLMTSRDLSHSRPLDIHRWSSYKEVDEWVDKLWKTSFAKLFKVEQRAGVKAQQTPRNMFKVLLLDLYVLWLEDPSMCLGVSRTKAHYAPNSRYNALHISFKLVEVIDALIEQGLIEQHLGTESARKVTRIWPTKELVKFFMRAAFSEFMIETHKHRETVILNSKELRKDDDIDELIRLSTAKPIPYGDTDDHRIIPTRDLLRDYNELLTRTHIDLGCEELPELLTEHYNRSTKTRELRRISLAQYNKFVRRVFYRGDWNLGGRYHGGWWQQIPSSYRNHILIDGKYTIEADYSGFHIALAYALEGHETPSDPYETTQIFDWLTPEQQRADIKLLALTALNADSKRAAFAAFRDQRNRSKHAKTTEDRVSYTDEVLNSLLDTFLEAHEPISSYLCSDKGVELVALDGNITTRILKHFTDRDIPILTVHDSYIIQAEYELQLMKVMKKATQEELGLKEARIKQDQLSPTMIQTFKNMDRTFDDYSLWKKLRENVIKTDGYRQRLNRFKRFLTDQKPN